MFVGLKHRQTILERKWKTKLNDHNRTNINEYKQTFFTHNKIIINLNKEHTYIYSNKNRCRSDEQTNIYALNLNKLLHKKNK